MDGDTAIRCWFELLDEGPHWQDAVPLLREEIESTAELSEADRRELLFFLDHWGYEPYELARLMESILFGVPSVAVEFADWATKRMLGERDDRRG